MEENAPVARQLGGVSPPRTERIIVTEGSWSPNKKKDPPGKKRSSTTSRRPTAGKGRPKLSEYESGLR